MTISITVQIQPPAPEGVWGKAGASHPHRPDSNQQEPFILLLVTLSHSETEAGTALSSRLLFAPLPSLSLSVSVL